jgi:hypothetical protein
MIPKPGLYADAAGLLAVGEGCDGEVVAVRIPLDLDELEAAGQRIVEVARRLKEAQRQAVAGGERPKIVELRRSAAWN